MEIWRATCEAWHDIDPLKKKKVIFNPTQGKCKKSQEKETTITQILVLLQKYIP